MIHNGGLFAMRKWTNYQLTFFFANGNNAQILLSSMIQIVALRMLIKRKIHPAWTPCTMSGFKNE